MWEKKSNNQNMKNDPRAEIKISFISKVAWQTLLMSHSCVHMKYERGKIYSFREMINWHSNQRLYPELILLLFSTGEKRDSVSTKKVTSSDFLNQKSVNAHGEFKLMIWGSLSRYSKKMSRRDLTIYSQFCFGVCKSVSPMTSSVEIWIREQVRI